MALDFQDGISHQAAKPERMESNFLMVLLDFQDGISHQAAKPKRMSQIYDQILIKTGLAGALFWRDDASRREGRLV